MTLRMRILAAFLLSLVLFADHAVSAEDERRFPHSRITAEQWQTYFEEASAKPGSQIRDYREFTLFEVAGGLELYVFTKPVHPAHPAAIYRRISEKDGAFFITTHGYYAGSQAAFDPLFAWYKEADVKIREYIERTRGRPAPAGPSR